MNDNVTCAQCAAINTITSRYCHRCGYELPKPKVDPSAFPPLVQTKKNKQKNRIGFIVGIGAFILVALGVGYFIFNFPSMNKDMVMDQAMVQIANEVNKNCPIIIDEATRLDNVAAMPDRIFQYNYSLVTLEKNDISVDTLKKYLEPKILSNAKTNPEMEFLRRMQATFIYYYKDKNGEFVHQFEVTPDMYE